MFHALAKRLWISYDAVTLPPSHLLMLQNLSFMFSNNHSPLLIMEMVISLLSDPDGNYHNLWPLIEVLQSNLSTVSPQVMSPQHPSPIRLWRFTSSQPHCLVLCIALNMSSIIFKVVTNACKYLMVFWLNMLLSKIVGLVCSSTAPPNLNFSANPD